MEGRSVALKLPLISASFKGELSPNWFNPCRKVDAGRNSAIDLQAKWSSAGGAPERGKPAFALGCARRCRSAGASDSISRRGRAKPLDVRTAHNQLLSGELRLRRIEVLGDRGPIASFEGRELLDILTLVGIDADDTRAVGPGNSAPWPF